MFLAALGDTTGDVLLAQGCSRRLAVIPAITIDDVRLRSRSSQRTTDFRKLSDSRLNLGAVTGIRWGRANNQRHAVGPYDGPPGLRRKVRRRAMNVESSCGTMCQRLCQ